MGLELYRQQFSEFEAWKRALIQELDQLVKNEYDDLEILINRIEEGSEECRGLGRPSPVHKGAHCDLSDLIRRQNSLINALISYAQELEDLCISVSSQLSSLSPMVEPPQLGLGSISEQIKSLLSLRR